MARKPFDPNLIKEPDGEQASARTDAGSGKTTRGGAKATASSGPLSVSQVTSMVARAIEAALPSTVHVVGEISTRELGRQHVRLCLVSFLHGSAPPCLATA